MEDQTGGHQAGPRVFRTLFVCTGNICRSAYAEFLARQLLVDRLGPAALDQFSFSSAGVRALVGRPMHPDTRVALAPWGYSAYKMAGEHVARQLGKDDITAADLILTAEEAHRPIVAWISADALPKMYTMRGFASICAIADELLLSSDPLDRAVELVESARWIHASLRPFAGGEEPVPDPIGGSARDHLLAADLVYEVVAAVVDTIAPLRLRGIT
jgi:protein-tyrosine phosphatase